MTLADYLSNHSLSNVDIDSYNKQSFAKKVIQFDSSIELLKGDVVILGVEESRGSMNKKSDLAPDEIRKQLYSLSDFFQSLRIIDLGNLKQGKTIKDTYAALEFVLNELLSIDTHIIIIGGTQNLTIPCFSALEQKKIFTNIVSIDSRFDLGIDDEIDVSQNHFNQIFKKGSKYLFDFVNIGYQSYFVSKDDIDLINNKLSFDSIRLGKARANIAELEPLIRDAHIVSFDIGAVRSESAPGNYYASPNGFTSDEACQLSRYAGLSNNTNLFGLFEINPEFEINNQTALLGAQIIWYYLEGLLYRKEEDYFTDSSNFKKYIVSLKEDYTITFYKSELTDRWWFEIPYQKLKDRNVLISCSYSDYLLACDQEVPDRWWRSYQKVN